MSLPRRSDCRCICHHGAGATHVVPCCQDDMAYPVTIGVDGSLRRADGSTVETPGLEPRRILASLEDEREGRMRPLADIIQDRNA